MGSRIFKGSSLEECLQKACTDMNLKPENLEYKVVEEKKGLFKKTITISVKETCNEPSSIDGKVFVHDGKIFVKDPEEKGKPASLSAEEGIILTVNGEVVKDRVKVVQGDTISYTLEEKEAQRTLDIKIKENGLEAYLSIVYVPKARHRLKETSEMSDLVLKKEVMEETFPETYTVGEVKDALSKLGIKFGIIEGIEARLMDKPRVEILIARGIPAEDDTDDIIEYKFKTERAANSLGEEDAASIDYRNLNEIPCVKKGDIIAVKVQGKVGKNGTDIYGNTLKKKEGKRRILKLGSGCGLKDQNTAISSVDGRPSVKNSILYVHEIYEVPTDVDMKTGNIRFVGDVKIFGGVSQGMKVEAGGAVYLEKDVENSDISASGDIVIKGNVLASKVTAGGQDVIIQRRIKDLENFISSIKLLEETIIEIKKFNLLGYNKEDGEIIKVLLETKFKTMNKTCINIVKDSVYDEPDEINDVVSSIRQMLVGMAPLGIKHFSELDCLIDVSQDKVNQLSSNLAIPVDVNIAYSQDSCIRSSGDICISGKGEYVSTIAANGSIIFTYDKGIARGGELQAGKEIRCKIVGSTGGVLTTLSVAEKGHIWIDVAYQSTKLRVGSKETIFDKPYKGVHAFIDDKGELIVDKLKL
ncbi:MAG: FapA family protein [Bacillota bacterium]|nr:FapA family protein [Bacillota bacterium]